MQKKIAFLTWGNSSQIRSFQDFNRYLDDMLYVRELDRHDLSQYAAIVVPDPMDGPTIARQSKALNDYVRQGGFLVVFGGKHVAEWIDVVKLDWRPVHARDWLYWTKPGGRLEIHQPEPHHPICDSIPLRDMSWHWAGVFGLDARATSALNHDEEAASLFLDFADLPGGGRLIVTTLDPHVHNGERFMPATRRFLDGFYPWLNREVGIERDRQGFVLTYLQSYHHTTEWHPDGLAESLVAAGGETRFLPLYELSAEALAGTDILYIPNNHDQLFLRAQQGVMIDFLKRGGHLVINSEPAIGWLPFMGTFSAVPPRPFSNMRVRVRHDPLGLFANMDAEFDGWEGVFGQYARGWTPMPEGAVWLTDVGTAEDPKPADWLWHYPSDDGKAGWVFMHNGDNMIRYPDHGPHQFGLVRDICAGLMRHGLVAQPASAAAAAVA